MAHLVFMTMNLTLEKANLSFRLRYRWELDAIRTSRRIFTLIPASTRVVSSILTNMTSFKRTVFFKGSDNFLDTTMMRQVMITQGERLDISYTREIPFPGRSNAKPLYHVTKHSHSSHKDFLWPTTQSSWLFGHLAS